MLLGITYLVMCKVRKSCLFKGHPFSNNTKIGLFISNATIYVPIKLNRIAGSINLFNLRGRLTLENVRFKRNWIWDVLEIDWRDMNMTINGNLIPLPATLVISLREKKFELGDYLGYNPCSSK